MPPRRSRLGWDLQGPRKHPVREVLKPLQGLLLCGEVSSGCCWARGTTSAKPKPSWDQGSAPAPSVARRQRRAEGRGHPPAHGSNNPGGP